MSYDLTETSKLMRTQSNRHTQFPLFIIQEEQEVVKAEGCGDEIKYIDGSAENELTVEQYEAIEEFQDSGEASDVLMELVAEEMTDLEDVKKWDLYDYRRIEISREWVYRDDAGFFFTEAACELHIRQNHYHYNKPRSYVISAWRNPELVATMQMILKLTGDDIPSCYQ